MRLGAGDVQALLIAVYHPHEHVLVGLLMGRLAAIALGVRHAGGDDQVVALQALQQLQEAAVVLGAVGLVDVIGERVHDRDAVEAGTALEAGAG